MPRSGSIGSIFGSGVLLGMVILAPVLFRSESSAHTIPAAVTWTGTVARVLQTNCVACHGAEGTLPPRLDEYESARRAAPAIKRAVLTRHMPRWHAFAGFGDFANDPSLTPHEIELLALRADGGAPLGAARPLPRAVANRRLTGRRI